ncbi:hypothetical protein GCM10007052_29850 [Halioglobus japonicus]|nr:hypothetical protein GCM10007052_29850 [Halioglobus japonicus]
MQVCIPALFGNEIQHGSVAAVTSRTHYACWFIHHQVTGPQVLENVTVHLHPGERADAVIGIRGNIAVDANPTLGEKMLHAAAGNPFARTDKSIESGVF